MTKNVCLPKTIYVPFIPQNVVVVDKKMQSYAIPVVLGREWWCYDAVH